VLGGGVSSADAVLPVSLMLFGLAVLKCEWVRGWGLDGDIGLVCAGTAPSWTGTTPLRSRRWVACAVPAVLL
jgi:hypothetical protein